MVSAVGCPVKAESYRNGGHTEVSYWETSMSNAYMLPVISNSRNSSSLFSGVQYPDIPNCVLVCVLSLLQKWFYVQLSLSQIEVFIPSSQMDANFKAQLQFECEHC